MPSARIQFTIPMVFCFTTFIAVTCVVTKSEGILPYWSAIPVAILIAACFMARRCLTTSSLSAEQAKQHSSPDFAWGLIALAWLVTTFDMTKTLIECFGHASHPLLSEMRELFLRAYTSTVALPGFLTIPSVYLAVRATRQSSASRARKWLVSCAVITIVDGIFATVFIWIIIGYIWQ